jgi:hypothetical protein
MARRIKSLLVLFSRKEPLQKKLTSKRGQLFLSELFYIKGICRQPGNLR